MEAAELTSHAAAGPYLL